MWLSFDSTRGGSSTAALNYIAVPMFSIRDADPARDAAACAAIYAPHVEGSAVSFLEIEARSAYKL